MDNELQITGENLVVVDGGHASPGLRSQRHLPIFKDADGCEYVFPNPQAPFTPIPVENIKGGTRRERRS